MEKERFERLVHQTRLGFWEPTVRPLTKFRTAEEWRVQRPQVKPADVLAYLISYMRPDLGRTATTLLRHGIEGPSIRGLEEKAAEAVLKEWRADPRPHIWWEALHLLGRHMADGGDYTDPGLARWITRTGREKPPRRKGADEYSFVRRLRGAAALVLVETLPLKPTRARESLRYPAPSRDAGIAEGGSACDVVAEATGVTYAVAEAAWGHLRKEEWIVKDRNDNFALSLDDSCHFLTTFLPADFGRPETIGIGSGRLGGPFQAEPWADLPHRLTAETWARYVPKQLVAGLRLVAPAPRKDRVIDRIFGRLLGH